MIYFQHASTNKISTVLRSLLTLMLITSLVCFGFFGTLGHLLLILSLLLSMMLWVFDHQNRQLPIKSDLILYLSLSLLYFWLLFRTTFSYSFQESFIDLAIFTTTAFISLLLFLFPNHSLRVNSLKLSQFSAVSILIVITLYSILSSLPVSLENQYFFTDYQDTNRLRLYSNNPIPFSLVVLTLGILSMVGWKEKKTINRFFSIIILLFAFYICIKLSMVRSHTLAIIVCIPLISWYITTRLKTFFLSLFAFFFLFIGYFLIDSQSYQYLFDKTLDSLSQTLIGEENNLNLINDSDHDRILMWKAGIESVKQKVWFGYGSIEMFNSTTPYLTSKQLHYSHPHNDFLSATIAGGVLGFLLSIILFLSPLIACLVSNKSRSQYFIALSMTVILFVTAMTNTVFYTDIILGFLVFITIITYWLDDNSDKKENL